MNPAVSVTDLTVAYRERPVLWDIDHELALGHLEVEAAQGNYGAIALFEASSATRRNIPRTSTTSSAW